MAEIQLTRIKSLYGEINGLFKALPKITSGPYIIPSQIGRNYNEAISELSQISGTSYERYKIPNVHGNAGGDLNIRLVQPLMSAVVSRLEEEYGFNKLENVTHPTIAIFNKNENTNSIEINYSINELIQNEKNVEGKIKLENLKQELEKENKNWEKIKPILIWILNFSKDLFIKVIPILLEKKL